MKSRFLLVESIRVLELFDIALRMYRLPYTVRLSARVSKTDLDSSGPLSI